MVMAATESQFHVLAVDDSIIDRKLIERLLKTSSYQGKIYCFLALALWLSLFFAQIHFDLKIFWRLCLSSYNSGFR